MSTRDDRADEQQRQELAGVAEPAKFIQILQAKASSSLDCTSPMMERLLALDEDGQIWWYNTDVNQWWNLPTARRWV